MAHVASPNDASLRPPAVAGRFYPGQGAECQSAAASYVRTAKIESLNRPSGAVVPHAGWVCSGAIAGEAIGTLAALAPAKIVVVFGAVHTPIRLEHAALDPHAVWRVPTGDSSQPLDALSKLSASPSFIVEARLHEREHAVEVELPLIQAAWPGAQVLPIEVPLVEHASRIGRETAEQVLAIEPNAVFLASSDLTHYGPAYRFAPAGIGENALTWAKENDRRLLNLIEGFEVDRIVPEVGARMNACGGGAIAAMLAACKVKGANRAQVLRHANSYETLRGLVPPDPTNAVGYAGVVVG